MCRAINPHAPDFKDARKGDGCFHAAYGECTVYDPKAFVDGIKIIRDTHSSNAVNAALTDGTSSYGMYSIDGKHDWNNLHPVLFNNFQQFLSYWAWEAEQRISREM